jgi:hypothetical protein
LERACNRIESAIADGGGAFTAWQIKEKFGGLRFYWYGDVSPETKSRIDEAIALAEARSACTCETCGEPGRLYQVSGCFTTTCRAHAPADVEPVLTERYDRATDSFVEMRPLRDFTLAIVNFVRGR